MLLPRQTSKPDTDHGQEEGVVYRKLTVNKPTGNFLPTDYLENPNAIPAAPANNEEANQERLQLMEEAIRQMNPNNSLLMDLSLIHI